MKKKKTVSDLLVSEQNEIETEKKTPVFTSAAAIND